MAARLHVGKLDHEAKTTVTSDMKEYMAELASKARCNASDIHREALYIGLTGMGYSAHVAKDMADALRIPDATQGEISPRTGP